MVTMQLATRARVQRLEILMFVDAINDLVDKSEFIVSLPVADFGL